MEHPLTAVLVGCGGISRAWLDAVRAIPGLTMTGFVDINPDAARTRAAEYGWTDAVIGSALEAVLAQTQPDIVFDCAVPEAHLPVTLTALAHGCHVLGEKPLAASMDAARQMVAAAQSSGRLFAVMQNRRYDANIRRLAAFLRSGAIGRITTVNADFYIGAHFGGFRDVMAHVLLLDMAIHTFDAARLIAAADPRAVYCHEWNPAGSWYARDASAVAIFEMSADVVFTYRGSWCAEGLRTTWESDWRIVGTEGSVRWDGAAGFQAEIVGERGGFFSTVNRVELPPPPADARIGGHAGAIREFVDCVRTGATPETTAADNIKSLAMVFGAIESASSKARVELTTAE
ncbi:MAG TPA: oxidoreductase [Chloroflexi bacterium]|nr:oxidoreductase [Chloroflexota bacterium]HHW87813.1 Gfo/Idh/MocA family oxidoreductase [Chloroflexota bacterium]